MFERLKGWARSLRHSLYALYLAYHRQDVTLAAKVVAVIVVSYALSPIDLIPDIIPIVGYLDDMILLPLGIALVIRLIPADIWAECQTKARQSTLRSMPRSKSAALLIICIWIILVVLLYRMMR